MEARGFLSLDLSPQSRDYLIRISSGAPMEYAQSPFCYLSDPAHPFQYSELDGSNVLDLFTAVHIAGAKTFLNPTTGRAEFCVYGKPDHTLAHYYPKQIGSFVPYFVWADTVNRSRVCRVFAISMVNSLMSDQAAITGTIQWTPLDSLAAACYNPETMSAFKQLNV